MEVLLCLLDYQDFFFLLGKNYYDAQILLGKLLLTMIPFLYYFDYFQNQRNSGFNAVEIGLKIYVFLLIYFFVFNIWYKRKKDENKVKSILFKIIYKFCVNFF